MRRFREPMRTGSEPVTDRFRQPVPGGGLYRPPEPVPTVQPKEDHAPANTVAISGPVARTLVRADDV